MKVRQVILARSIRQVAAINYGGPRIDAVVKVKEKYQFLKAPQRFDEIFPSNPVQAITFQGGRYTIDKREVGIAQMQFVQNMLVVDTQTSTDDSDWLADDYISTANQEHPDSVTQTGPPFYLSHIEFTLERPPDLPPQFADASKVMDRFLADYGVKVPAYDFWGS